MEPLTETDILEAFEGASEEIVLPNLNEVAWDNLDYLGWIHPSGHLGYMVVISPDDGIVKGAVLRRSRFNGNRPAYEMCSLCHHVHQPNGTAMFTITNRENEKRHSLGNVICKDLDCSLRVRNLLTPSSYLNETLYTEAKIWRMQLALHKWLRTANRL